MKCAAVDDEEEVVGVEVDLAAVLLKVAQVDLFKAVPVARVVLHQLTRKRVAVLDSSHWRA